MRNVFLLCLLILPVLAASQQYNFHKYSIEEGLPRSASYSLFQDKDGFLWIGLDGGGVAMFNGESFECFDMSNGLPSHKVRSVFEDSRGNVWFGTTNGLCKYDHHTLKVYTEEDGLCDNYIRSLEEDDQGSIWIATNNGLSVFDGEKFCSYGAEEGLLAPKVRIVYKTSDGSIWVGTDNGINIVRGKKLTEFGFNDSLPSPVVLELCEDSRKNVWAGTKGGLVKVNGKSITQYSTDDGLVQNRIRAICEDSYGNMWFGTRAGVSRFDGYKFYNYDQSNGLSHDRIRDIIMDNSGNLWFATYFGGINKFSQGHFIAYTSKEGLQSNQVFSIASDANGDIILGTFDGVSALSISDDQLDTVLPIWTDKLPDPRVFAMHLDEENRFWVGTQEGLMVVEDEQYHFLNELNGLVHNQITAISSRGSTFWIGTEKGLSKIEVIGSLSRYNLNNLIWPEVGTEVSSILNDDEGNTFISYRDGGIIIISAKGDTIKPKLPEEVQFITSMVNRRNNAFWVGTDGSGLFELQLSTSSKECKVISRINVNQGIESNHIYTILQDLQGNLWIGTEKGIDYLTFDEDGLRNVSHFGTKQGLPGIEVNENAAFLDGHGRPWFGTVGGAVNKLIDNKLNVGLEPQIYITSVSLFGDRLKIGNEFGLSCDSRFHIPNEFVLEHNQNTVGFDFYGINLTSPEGVKYKWILEGFEEEWTSPKSRHRVNYTNLPPGDYIFKVLASNEEGIWNNDPATLRFTIESPFWKKTWFLIVAGVFGFLIFYSISQWRVRRLKRAKKELEEKVAKATKALRNEKELVEHQHKEIELKKLELEEINQSFRDSINYAKRIQKALMEPQAALVDKIQGNAFVFHRAKDIVSGDFFWFRDSGDSSYVAAADCTGHGVPGAFMSMIGIAFLNQIVNRMKSQLLPDEILFKQRDLVVKALIHDGDDQSKDGMDMALCRVDWPDNKLHYAGSYNPLYHVRDGVLTEIKANKMPIGASDFDDQPFDGHSIDIKKGDMVYLFSDGYADQFGGPKSKKYKYRPFKFFLESICDFPLEKQKIALENEIDRWMGDNEQNDDIIVIGIRI